MPSVQIKRGTAAALTALAGTSSLLVGEQYLITDEGRIAVATSASTFVKCAKLSEVGGGAGLLSTAINVAAVALGYAEVVVAAAGVLPTSKVVASFAATLDDENDVEALADSAMAVTGVPETDQIRFVLTSANGSRFVGPFNVDYQVTV